MVWASRPPLSHLREIDCRAFAQIPTNNSTVFHRSSPCVLIGYAPNSKVYRLWDPTTERIFNSFHVNFIEQIPSFRQPPPLTRDTWNECPKRKMGFDDTTRCRLTLQI
jgi:hypothetical protein